MALLEDPKGRKEGYVKGPRKLVLLDASHLMHRAYWAIQRSLATSKGEQTNAVFGVASMLLTLLPREQPDLLMACFDEGKETFRHRDHAEYKAGRPETPDDFYQQIPRVHECLQAFSIPILSHPTYEADDLIGTLAKRGVEEGYDVTVVSGDRDLFQLASERITIAVPEKGYTEPQYLDTHGVEKKLGVHPRQVPDYKGLTGDPSDNLKGVRGIGPKTATELLKKYGSLEGVYEHRMELREGLREKLEADRESAFLCRNLATLVTDVPLPIDVKNAPAWQAGTENIDAFFQHVEFHTLRRRFGKMLEENAYLQSHVRGNRMQALPENDRMTQDQLPMLDEGAC